MQGDSTEMLKKPQQAQECFMPSEKNGLNSQIFKGSFIVRNEIFY